VLTLKRPAIHGCRSSLSPSAAARHASFRVIWELSARPVMTSTEEVLSLIYVAVFPSTWPICASIWRAVDRRQSRGAVLHVVPVFVR